MTETQKRIKVYQELLPALRERVIAVALLLAMSASMLSSASFAWLTLSRNPEVTAVNTTVAANGNLEIALAEGDRYTATAPGESQVGDSSATKGQSVTAANVTWGNLVNLADPSYGLDKMVLRPAQLNRSSLLDSPLYGATYGEDGRTENLSSDFAYATWEKANQEAGLNEDSFVINNKLGVRAITSVVYQADAGTSYQAKVKRDAAEHMNGLAGEAYKAITQDKDLMGSLATVMGVYLTAMLNDSNETVAKGDVYNLSEIFRLFIDAYELQIQAMVNLANFQLFVYNSTDDGVSAYQEYTVESLMAATESTLKPGVYLPGLNQMKADYNMLKNNYSSDAVANDMLELVAQAEASGSLAYNAMEHIVDSLVVVGPCLVGDKTVDYLSANKSQAISLVTGGGTHEVKITNGVLYNFEKLNGTRAKIQNMSIKARYMITVTLKANITTNAPTPHQFQMGLDYGDDNNDGGPLAGYSQDTYGLAIDLWVRTNAEDSALTLEGNVLTESKKIFPKITVSDEVYTAKVGGVKTNMYALLDGNNSVTWYELYTTNPVIPDATPEPVAISTEYDLYTLTITHKDEQSQETMSYSIDVYNRKNRDGSYSWVNASTHVEVDAEDLKNQTPSLKVEEIETVVGYEGENRIWDSDKNALISSDATTQGSGSCYVYYADTPEDQARSLALLDAFKVAFVDEAGELLATASMDTGRFYATTGRVIVPLKLDEDSSIPLKNEATGKVTYAITRLEKNVPTRITALVYLDGTRLYNENVLSAADIQGRLNIQFGSSEEVEPIRNTELENKLLSVSASLSDTEFNFDDADSDMTTTVTVKVDGSTPNNVTAFFLREINASQGSREKTVTFTQNAAGDWVADYKFTAPGSYVLRSVQLDGVEYDLPLDANGQPLRVTVSGFSLEYLRCAEGALNVMTADASKTVNLELKFNADDVNKMPKKVQGRYLRRDGTAVNVDFTMDSNSHIWKGAATFVASGDYTMQYLILDGEYTELDPSFWLTANLTLGMRVAVRTNSPTKFTFIPDLLTPAQRSLGMEVEILDSEGESIPSLAGAYLYYGKDGSGELEKGMSTPLTWDPAEECYTGTFSSKIGRFNFSSVTVGSNTLTNDGASSPTFQIMSPEPPAFVRDATEKSQPVIGTNDAVMEVVISNSDAASVKALLTKEDVYDAEGKLKTFTVYGVPAGDDYWSFAVPLLNSENNVAQEGQKGNQDGRWTIQEIHVFDAYNTEGEEYTEESPLVFGNSEYEFTPSKVISVAYVTLTRPANWDATLGGDAPTETGDSYADVATAGFLTSHSIEGLQIEIKDFDGDPIEGASVNLSYSYDAETEEYGGYTSTGVKDNTDYCDVVFQVDGTDKGKFVQTKPITASQAGIYTAVLTYDTAKAKNIPVDAADFNFTVQSKKPEVKVTATNPTAGSTTSVYGVSNPGTQGQLLQGDFFKVSDHAATVYLYTPTGSNKYYLTVNEPTVTLSLSGVPSGYSNASMTFNAERANSVGSTFSFGSVATATASIGKATDGSSSLSGDTFPVLYPAGRMTQDKLTLDHGGNTYEITLANPITIEQPQAPAAVQFMGIPDTYTGTRPGTVYGEGSTVTVELPLLTWTETIERAADTSANWSGYTAVGTVDEGKVYGFKSYTTGRIIKTAHKDYQYYEWTKFESSYTGVTNIYHQNKRVAKWLINGKEYTAGETVTLENEGIITATAVVGNLGTEALVDTVEQTSYKYLYGYVKSNEVKDYEIFSGWVVNHKPTGNMIGSTVTSEGGAYPTPKIANASTANANTDTPGTNMTANSGDYMNYWP